MSILSYIKLDIEWFTHRPLVMRKGSGSMYCLFRLLHKPMLIYCQFNSHGYISITFYNFKYFIQKSILKMPPAVWRAFCHRFCRQSYPKSRPQTLHPPMLVNVECRKKNIRVIISLLFIRECSDWIISVMNAFSRIFHSVWHWGELWQISLNNGRFECVSTTTLFAYQSILSYSNFNFSTSQNILIGYVDMLRSYNKG